MRVGNLWSWLASRMADDDHLCGGLFDLCRRQTCHPGRGFGYCHCKWVVALLWDLCVSQKPVAIYHDVLESTLTRCCNARSNVLRKTHATHGYKSAPIVRSARFLQIQCSLSQVLAVCCWWMGAKSAIPRDRITWRLRLGKCLWHQPIEIGQ